MQTHYRNRDDLDQMSALIPVSARCRRSPATLDRSAFRKLKTVDNDQAGPIDKGMGGLESTCVRPTQLLSTTCHPTRLGIREPWLDRFRNRLSTAESFHAIRNLEANAYSSYFREWRDLPVTWPKNDLQKIPVYWRFVGGKQSPLTGGPRLAVTPAHAILNCCFALLQAETRLALSALGLNPGLGVGLHTDTANRDSLAFDVLEPVRSQVEAWLLDWIAKEPCAGPTSSKLEQATVGSCLRYAPSSAGRLLPEESWLRLGLKTWRVLSGLEQDLGAFPIRFLQHGLLNGDELRPRAKFG
jgi:hypothetical protein